jgi:hypothetical protein
METYSDELSEYLSSIVRAVEKGLAGSQFEADDPLVLDLAIINSKKTDGSFEIFVVKGKKEYGDELSRIRLTLKKRVN